MSFSIDWTEEYPRWKRPLAYLRLAAARRRYGIRLGVGLRKDKPHFAWKKPGYQSMIYRLQNAHEGVRCFILGDSESTGSMNLSFLRNEITIASNDTLALQGKIGKPVSYFTCTDSTFLEKHSSELAGNHRSIRIFGLGNSYCAPIGDRTLFANVCRSNDERIPFSGDFAAVAFAGSSSAYLNLQLAFHLGCNPIYLLGVCPAHTDGLESHDARIDRELAVAAEYCTKRGRQVISITQEYRDGIFTGRSMEEVLIPQSVREPRKEMSFGIHASNLDEVVKMIMPKREKSDRYYEKALKLCKGGKPESAVNLLERALESGPNAHAAYMRASLLKSLGRKSEAAEAFHSLLENERLTLDRNVFGGAHFHLGEMSFQLGEYVAARHHFIKCLEAVPSHGKASEYMRVIRSEGASAFSTEETEALVR